MIRNTKKHLVEFSYIFNMLSTCIISRFPKQALIKVVNSIEWYALNKICFAKESLGDQAAYNHGLWIIYDNNICIKIL